MSLSSLQLDAFHEVTKAKSFSQAADRLGVTQSALSQRVLNLEEELGSSLFVRDPKGLRLTPAGQTLLSYCQSREALEEETTSLIKSDSHELTGAIRLATFSSIMASVVLPTIASIVHEAPNVRVELQTREVHTLTELLKSGAVDFILTPLPMQIPGVLNHLVGHEENVLAKRKKGFVVEDVYLDHDENDPTTYDFFNSQAKSAKVPAKWRRTFTNGIEMLMESTKLGLGLAVLPVHLLKNQSELMVVKGFSPMKTPVYLCEYERVISTKLHSHVSQVLRSKISKIL